MRKITRGAAAILVTGILIHLSILGQAVNSKPESSKYRTICTVSGAGGGFVLGVFLGIAAFDDAINSDRKVWTAALLTAAGGGVAGYFLGRSLDRRATTDAFRWNLEPVDLARIRMEQRVYGWRPTISSLRSDGTSETGLASTG